MRRATGSGNISVPTETAPVEDLQGNMGMVDVESDHSCEHEAVSQLEESLLELLELHDELKSKESKLVHRHVSLTCAISSCLGILLLVAALLIVQNATTSFLSMCILGCFAMWFLHAQAQTIDELLQSEKTELKESQTLSRSRKAKKSAHHRRRSSELRSVSKPMHLHNSDSNNNNNNNNNNNLNNSTDVYESKSEAGSDRDLSPSTKIAEKNSQQITMSRLSRGQLKAASRNMSQNLYGSRKSDIQGAQSPALQSEEYSDADDDEEEEAQSSLVDLVNASRRERRMRFAIPYAKKFSRTRQRMMHSQGSSRRLRWLGKDKTQSSSPGGSDEEGNEPTHQRRHTSLLRSSSSSSSSSPSMLSFVGPSITAEEESHESPTNTVKAESRLQRRQSFYRSLFKSSSETEGVEELRRSLSDIDGSSLSRPVDLSDVSLLRFLRAFKHDVQSAETGFRGALQWRQDRRPDLIYEKLQGAPHPITSRYMTGSWCGNDRSGAPVMYDRLGQLDLPSILACVSPTDIEEFHIWKQEVHTRLLADAEQMSGQPQHQILVILDMQGLGLRHCNRQGMRIIKNCIAMDSKYYCERLKRMLIINAGSIFANLWGVVKNVVDDDTREKIQIFRDTPTKLLLELIEPSQLPKYLGGDLVIEGDPYCSKFIKPGGSVPADVIKSYKSQKPSSSWF